MIKIITLNPRLLPAGFVASSAFQAVESIKSDDSYTDLDIDGLGLGSDGSSQAVESIKSLHSYEDLDIAGLSLGSDGWIQ